MKIIEAMKTVKYNKEKIQDLQVKISGTCANLSHETPVYGTNTHEMIMSWTQTCDDLSQESIRLLCAIQRTNLATPVTIKLGEKQVTKTIAEWVWRRREYATVDLKTWQQQNDRGLKEGFMNSSTGTPTEVKIVRHFDPVKRDQMLAMYKQEPSLIDSTLEVINATTDLL